MRFSSYHLHDLLPHKDVLLRYFLVVVVVPEQPAMEIQPLIDHLKKSVNGSA